MKKNIQPVDLSALKTYSIQKRKSKVTLDNFAKPWPQDQSILTFIDHLPTILAGNDLREIIEAIVTIRKNENVLIFGMGAHVIKVGLNPIVIDLMKNKIISAIAMNGAGIIHDLEIAMHGQTSEDVAEALQDGSFGMSHETGFHLSNAILLAKKESLGLGAAIGKYITSEKFPHLDQSLLANGHKLNLPITVHIAIGTDIIHMHPSFDPGAAGQASHLDFRIFAALVSQIENGMYMNVGSAVVLPEIFLKAITLVRNLGFSIENFTSLNMDFIRHYRPMTNVVNRPTAKGGKGYNLVGHHEIMLPLIAAAVLQRLAK